MSEGVYEDGLQKGDMDVKIWPVLEGEVSDGELSKRRSGTC